MLDGRRARKDDETKKASDRYQKGEDWRAAKCKGWEIDVESSPTP
jgi:hypothetical protein